mmetsp:Transcript_8828/g.21730  ORF Transcript_8828/g.21730 Transcript_8828/m.21730 type:complete len:373 (-) Transcript_8828:94-1212(-)
MMVIFWKCGGKTSTSSRQGTANANGGGLSVWPGSLLTMGQKIKELREKMKTARTLYRAEKTNKKLKRAYLTSKQELHKAKEKKKAKLSLKKESKAPESVVPAGCFIDRKGDRNLVSKSAERKENHSTVEREPKKKGTKRKKSQDHEPTDSSEDPLSKPAKERSLETKGEPAEVRDAKPLAPKGKRKIFVSNLSFDVDEKAIKDLFAPCGAVTEVSWLEKEDSKNRGQRIFMGCAYVTFATADGAKKAVERGGLHHMKRDIRVEFSRDKTSAMAKVAEGARSCFVGNLPFTATEDQLREWAGGDGAGVVRVWMPRDQNGKHKGSGFVDFKDTASLRDFVQKNGTVFSGRKIRLRPKPPSTKKKRRRRKKKSSN